MSNDKKNIIAIVVVVIVAFLIGYFFNSNSSNTYNVATDTITEGNTDNTSTDTQQDKEYTENLDKLSAAIVDLLNPANKSVIRGNKNAEVLIVEYSDFECPFCAQVHPHLIDVLEQRQNVGWIYKHLPLNDIHPLADTAARVSECIAREKGGDEFWKFTDDLFVENKFPLSNKISFIEKVSKEYQIPSLTRCVEEPEIANRVIANAREAITLGITGTPGFYVINTRKKTFQKIPGGLPAGELIKIIDRL